MLDKNRNLKIMEQFQQKRRKKQASKCIVGKNCFIIIFVYLSNQTKAKCQKDRGKTLPEERICGGKRGGDEGSNRIFSL
jgi:hypothetical protein